MQDNEGGGGDVDQHKLRGKSVVKRVEALPGRSAPNTTIKSYQLQDQDTRTWAGVVSARGRQSR
jgi:hypothetical protein